MINFGPFISMLLNKSSRPKERQVKTIKECNMELDKINKMELDKINKMDLLEAIEYLKK